MAETIYIVSTLVAFIGSLWLIIAGFAELMDCVGDAHRKPGTFLSALSMLIGTLGYCIIFLPHFI